MTSDLAVVQLDPDDDEAFAAWYAVLHSSQQTARPGELDDLPHELRFSAREGRQPDATHRIVPLAAQASGRTLGVAWLELPLRDNTHLVELSLHVHPDERGQGAAQRLQVSIEELARAESRDTLLGYVDEPPGQQGSSVGRAWALGAGYELAQTEVRRDIALPLEPDRVARLERGSVPHAERYRIFTWVDRCPERWLEDRAELSRSMSVDVPKDATDYREEVWDAVRVRRHERRSAAMDRTTVVGGAVHEPTGRLVAYSELAVPRSEPARAFQWDTIVLAAHRGHRLGTLVKLAALRRLAELSPATRYVSTWNARENAHMIAVNDALGARTNGQEAALQKVLR